MIEAFTHLKNWLKQKTNTDASEVIVRIECKDPSTRARIGFEIADMITAGSKVDIQPTGIITRGTACGITFEIVESDRDD